MASAKALVKVLVSKLYKYLSIFGIYPNILSAGKRDLGMGVSEVKILNQGCLFVVIPDGLLDNLSGIYYNKLILSLKLTLLLETNTKG